MAQLRLEIAGMAFIGQQKEQFVRTASEHASIYVVSKKEVGRRIWVSNLLEHGKEVIVLSVHISDD